MKDEVKPVSIRVLLLVLFAVTAAIYARAASFPFSAIDDHVYVTKNYAVTSGFSLHSITWAFSTFHAGNWHPLTWISLMLDGQLFGRNPIGYHLHNVLLHGLSTSLLFLLLANMTGAIRRSMFVAACFALHPLHVESVAWVAERKDVLSGFFLMLTLLFYGVYAKQPGTRMYLLALSSFALGLLAKPMLVTLPVLMLLLDFWPLNRLKLSLLMPKGGPPSNNMVSLQRLLLEKIPFMVLAAASSLITISAQKSGSAVATLSQIPVPIRISNALWSSIQYIYKTIFPFDLAVYYPYALVPFWKAGFAVLVLGVITYAVVKNLTRHGYLAVGWLWYLVTLLPVIGLVQVGSQAMADRYTYIPSIGLFIMASWGGAELCRKLPTPGWIAHLAAGGVVLFLTAGTWIQLGYWRDNERLIEHTIAITENNYFAHFALGGFYEEQGKLDLAIAQYQEVLRINPGAKHAHFKMGTALLKQGRPEEAVNYLNIALMRTPRLADAHFYKGVALEKLGRTDEAVRAYTEALKLDSENPMYHTNLGSVLAQQGKLDDAVQLFTKALQLNPNDEKAGKNLQLALKLKSGMWESDLPSNRK